MGLESKKPETEMNTSHISVSKGLQASKAHKCMTSTTFIRENFIF
jgi:hypothetical protein